MRKGQKDASDADFEALLDSALALYRFTNDKDVFRTFYHRALAKRLLLERSASDDFEKAMLKKLKERTFIFDIVHRDQTLMMPLSRI
jgi:cullin-4